MPDPKPSIDHLISESFKGDTESVARYIDWLRSTMAGYQQSLRRSVALIAFLIVIFELMVASPGTQVTIASLHISKASIVFKFLPAVVAYLALQAVMETNRIDAVTNAYRAAFGKWLGGPSRVLYVYAKPPDPVYWSSSLANVGEDSSISSVDEFLSASIVLLLMLGTAAFEVQAYYILYHAPILHDIPFLISAGLSLLFTIGCVASTTS